MNFLRWRHPIFDMPFQSEILNDLEAEYRCQSRWDRAAAIRKVLQRELLAGLTGQASLRVERVPPGTRRMLWIYGWTALGDSLMDLAVRKHLPRSIAVDLLIPPATESLYRGDPFLNDVHCRPEQCSGDYDFVLLQHMSARLLRTKAQIAPRAPFSSVLGYLNGERFDRMTFAQRRMEQLFGIAKRPPASQHLRASTEAPQCGDRLHIAVALGARDPRRTFRNWSEALQQTIEQWPRDRASPLFVLLGDSTAQRDVASFPPEFVDQYCRVEIGHSDLRSVAASLARCHAFVGMDGGLMHMAAALGKPGLAVFAKIDPLMRLRPDTAMRHLFTQDVNRINANELAMSLCATLLSAFPIKHEQKFVGAL